MTQSDNLSTSHCYRIENNSQPFISSVYIPCKYISLLRTLPGIPDRTSNNKMRFLIAAVLASIFVFATCEQYFAGIPFSKLPEPTNRPVMARFIVTHANWTSYGYVSSKCGAKGCPDNALLAISDGPYGCGKGVPYFFASRHHPSVAELLDNDPRGAAVMSLAQTDMCREKGWDPQDPRCAHIVMKGIFVPINEKDPEHAVAKNALLGRHPQFAYYPSGHKFFFAKMNITNIAIISTFGGPVDVKLDEYFKVKC